jgi:hypothetical protein
MLSWILLVLEGAALIMVALLLLGWYRLHRILNEIRRLERGAQFERRRKGTNGGG